MHYLLFWLWKLILICLRCLLGINLLWFKLKYFCQCLWIRLAELINPNESLSSKLLTGYCLVVFLAIWQHSNNMLDRHLHADQNACSLWIQDWYRYVTLQGKSYNESTCILYKTIVGFSMFYYFVSGLGESLLQSWLFCNSEILRSANWNGMSKPLTAVMIVRFFVASVSMGSIKQSPLGLKKNGTEYLSVLIDRLTRCLVAR